MVVTMCKFENNGESMLIFINESVFVDLIQHLHRVNRFGRHYVTQACLMFRNTILSHYILPISVKSEKNMMYLNIADLNRHFLLYPTHLNMEAKPLFQSQPVFPYQCVIVVKF